MRDIHQRQCAAALAARSRHCLRRFRKRCFVVRLDAVLWRALMGLWCSVVWLMGRDEVLQLMPSSPLGCEEAIESLALAWDCKNLRHASRLPLYIEAPFEVGAAESTDIPSGKSCRSLPVPRRPANGCVVPFANDCFDNRGLHGDGRQQPSRAGTPEPAFDDNSQRRPSPAEKWSG